MEANSLYAVHRERSGFIAVLVPHRRIHTEPGWLFIRHEWTLYIFDAVPMFLVTVVFYFQHPSKLLSPLAEDVEYVEMDLEIAGLQHRPKY